jgi:hypothetical protein
MYSFPFAPVGGKADSWCDMKQKDQCFTLKKKKKTVGNSKE